MTVVMDPLTTATTFYGLGVATIPVALREKTPLLSSWKRYQTELPQPATLLAWFAKETNIGVVTGWRNLTVIDFDALDMTDTYGRWLSWAARQGRFSVAYQTMRNAYRVRTGRGIHVYVWLQNQERNRKLPGLDIKARNGYVLGEGSIHPSGALYRVLTPGMIIPTIATLSDVLPPELLLTTEQPAHVKPLPQVAEPADIWDLAENPRVTSNLVDQIRKTLRIEDLVGDLQRTGTHWYLTRCPLHDDDSPSFWVDTQAQICGCFSGCTTKPLDVINLYARLYGLNNREAIFYLARMLH